MPELMPNEFGAPPPPQRQAIGAAVTSLPKEQRTLGAPRTRALSLSRESGSDTSQQALAF
jgi:hypothetical protein